MVPARRVVEADDIAFCDVDAFNAEIVSGVVYDGVRFNVLHRCDRVDRGCLLLSRGVSRLCVTSLLAEASAYHDKSGDKKKEQ